MSRTYKDSRKSTGPGRQRNLTVRSVRKNPPDLRKLARAVIELAMAQAEAEAQAQGEAADRSASGPANSTSGDDRD